MGTEKKSKSKVNGLNIRCTDEIWNQVEAFREAKSQELGIEISRSSAVSMLISMALRQSQKNLAVSV